MDGARVSDVRRREHVGTRRAAAAALLRTGGAEPLRSARFVAASPRPRDWRRRESESQRDHLSLPRVRARLEEVWAWCLCRGSWCRRDCRRPSVPRILERLARRLSLLAPGRGRPGRQARGAADRARVDDRPDGSDVCHGPLRDRSWRFGRGHVSRARDRLDGCLDSVGRQARHRRLSLPAVRAVHHVRGVRRAETGTADARPGDAGDVRAHRGPAADTVGDRHDVAPGATDCLGTKTDRSRAHRRRGDGLQRELPAVVLSSGARVRRPAVHARRCIDDGLALERPAVPGRGAERTPRVHG